MPEPKELLGWSEEELEAGLRVEINPPVGESLEEPRHGQQTPDPSVNYEQELFARTERVDAPTDPAGPHELLEQRQADIWKELLYDRTIADQQPDPPLSEKVTTTAQGVISGVLETGPPVAGAIAGAKIGLALGALTGPLAPAAVPILGIGGGVVGWTAGVMAGEQLQYGASQVTIPFAESPLTFRNMEEVPIALRPYAYGGEMFGASLPVTGALFRASAAGVQFASNLAGRWLNGVIESARRAPMRFFALEQSLAGSAGTGTGYGEAVFPGEPVAHISGAVIGGVVNPVRLFSVMTSGAIRYVGKTLRAVAPMGGAFLSPVVPGIVPWIERASARQAVRALIEIIEKRGEDPIAIAAAIREAQREFPDLNLTAGVLSGSPVLRELEASFVHQSGQFGAASKQMAEDSLQVLRNMIHIFEQVGDPRSLRLAAELRQEHLTTLLHARILRGENEALEKAALIDPNRAGSRAQFGVEVGEIMEEVISVLRKSERELWDKVNKAVPGSALNIVTTYDYLSANRLIEESLPGVVEAFVKRITATQNFGTTSGELLIFRSRMLALSREAAGRGDWSDAHIYGELAESALDDLGSLGAGLKPTSKNRALVEANEADMRAARMYSRELNEAFTRTFAGRTLQVASTGARRIPPEMIGVRAFSTGKELGELHLRQLGDVARHASTEHLSRMLDLQERIIRNAAGAVIDPLSNQVIPRRLAKFLNDNEVLLDRFPEIRSALENAQEANSLLTATRSRATLLQKQVDNKSAFASILDFEDPAMVLKNIFEGQFPARDFTAMVKFARRSSPDAMKGLEATIYSYAYDRALKETGQFSFVAYRNVFEKPLTPNGPALKDLLLNDGIISKRHYDRLTKILNRATSIEKNMKGARDLGHERLQFGLTSYLQDFVLKITGVQFAHRVYAGIPGAGPNSLIVASAGSSLMRQVLDKIPKANTRSILMDLASDPKLMAILLEKGVTRSAQIKMARKLNAWLIASGITTLDRPERPPPSPGTTGNEFSALLSGPDDTPPDFDLGRSEEEIGQIFDPSEEQYQALFQPQPEDQPPQPEDQPLQPEDIAPPLQ